MYSVSNRDGRPCWSNILSFFLIVLFSFYGFRLFGRLLSRLISFPSEGEWLDVWLSVIKFLPFYIFLLFSVRYMNFRFLDIFLRGHRNGIHSPSLICTTFSVYCTSFNWISARSMLFISFQIIWTWGLSLRAAVVMLLLVRWLTDGATSQNFFFD